MVVDQGFSRRNNIDREIQPVAIVSVDPPTRTAMGMTRIRTIVTINCAYATGETLTTPAVGEQWYVERFDLEWRLYGRIPFNDATLNIEAEEGQVSIGSALGPLELNGTVARFNTGLFRLGKFYYRDNGVTLQRSPDGKNWTSIVAIAENASAIAADAAAMASQELVNALDPLNTDNSLLGEDFINSLNNTIRDNLTTNETIRDLYTKWTSARDKADEAFKTALGAKLANEAADALTDWKARAGSNLCLDGAFNDASLKRFPLNDYQFSGYSLLEAHHSGIQAWKWHHYPDLDCGFAMAPTVRINHFDVAPGEIYFVECWVYPDPSNDSSKGNIRIGGTFSDTSGTLNEAGDPAYPNKDVYLEYPLFDPNMVSGVWNKINIDIEVPEGYDKVKFWVMSTANTPGGNIFTIDDCLVRENTFPRKAQLEANLANFVVNLKAAAGTNLFLDPRFSLGKLVTRFPYNDDAVYDYAVRNNQLGHPKPHSGLGMWKWIQEYQAACGLSLAPTQKVELYQVNGGEKYSLEAWIYPHGNNSGTGSIRIGATFSDSAGDLISEDLYATYNIASSVPTGQWTKVETTVEVPGGYDTGRFWVIATADATAGDIFFVDDCVLRESTASVKAQAQADFAESLVDAKSRAGINLVLDPKFTNRLITRYPYSPTGSGTYTTSDHHSGLQCWSWTHSGGGGSGLILNPTAKINTYQVSAEENYMVTAWVKPVNAAYGTIRVGASFIDTAGINPMTDDYTEFAIPAAVPSGSWTQVSAPIVIPEGFDTARFWVVSVGAAEGSTFLIDDVGIKDNTAAEASAVQAKAANLIVDLKSKAGANLVIDPTFSNILVGRWPYNPNQTSSYTTEKRYSGLTAWKWTQSANISCGIILAPTVKVDTYQVLADENYSLEAYVYPFEGNSDSNPVVRIGATFYDTSGDLSPTSSYIAPTISRGAWNRIATTITVPYGYQEAKFWVIAPSTTPAGSIFYIDNLLLKEVTASESVVTGISSSVTGTSTTGNTTATTVADKIRSAWAKFVDGLRGHSPGTTASALPVDVYSAAASARSAADTGVANAAAAQTTANTATQVAADASVAASMEQGANLVSNPGFKNLNIPLYDMVSGVNPTPYNCYSTEVVRTTGGTSVKTVGDDHGAVQCIMGQYGAPWEPKRWWFTQVDCNPGDVFYCEAWLFNKVGNSTTTGGYAALVAGFWSKNILNASDTYSSSELISTQFVMDQSVYTDGLVKQIDVNAVDLNTIPQGQWTKLWGYITIPEGCHGLEFRLQTRPVVPGSQVMNTYYWADPVLTKGDKAALNEALTAKAVAADAAVAVAASMEQGANLVSNPGFKNPNIPLYDMVVGVDGGTPYNTYSQEVVRTPGGTSVKTVGDTHSLVQCIMGQYGAPWEPKRWWFTQVDCNPGDVFYMEAWVYNKSGNGTTVGGYASLQAGFWAKNVFVALENYSSIHYLGSEYVMDSSVYTGGLTKQTGINAVDTNSLPVDQWTKLWGYVTIPEGCYGLEFRLQVRPTVYGAELMNTYYWADPVLASGDARAATALATAAVSAANTANGTASAAVSNNQQVVDGISQSVYDNGVTNNATTTVKSRLQAAWAAIYDGLHGSQGSAAKVPNDVYQAAASVKSTASAASSAASTAHDRVDSTNTALFGGVSPAAAITTTAVPNLPASKITSGTLATSVLPIGTGAVGSGFIMRNTTDSFSVSCSANTPTPIKLTTAFYDSTASGTSDYAVSTGGSGELNVTASNPGWYMVEVAFGIAQTPRAVGYRIAAAMFLNGSIHKIGSTVDYFGSLSAQIPFACQGAFIVYLNNGDYVTPGLMLYSQSSISSSLASGSNMLAPNFANDTYFSVSLLNRSLA